MLGWARRINWGHWKRLKMLAIALVAVSAFPVAASAGLGLPAHEAPAIGVEAQEYLQIQSSSGALIVGDSPQLRQVEPSPIVGDAPSLRRSGPSTVYTTDGSRTFGSGEVALGSALAFVLTGAVAIALLFSRRRMRAANA